MWHAWGSGEGHAGFRLGKLEGRCNLGDLGIDWRVILK